MGKTTGLPRKKLLKYFRKSAKALGKAPAGAVSGKECYADGQAFYSLYWYFRSCIADDLDARSARYSPVLDAYLGAPKKDVFEPRPIDEATLRAEEEKLASLFPQSAYPLNGRQVEAVHKALHFPVSIIKGPPGTGKTETILRIVGLALERGETVAVTSTNAAAVQNVEEKVAEALAAYGSVTRPEAERIAQTDLAYAAAIKHVSLGSKGIREQACDPLTGANLAFDGGKHRFADGSSLSGWEKNKEFREFTSQFPFVTSTVHSLKKCFCDGDEAKYDLLIMDEASQSNLIVGIVALSCARRIVLVGDEEQLPPVASDDARRCVRAIAEDTGLAGRDAGKAVSRAFAPYDMAREDFSFLESCYEVFSARNPALRTMLAEHYRCHPAIIGFCNEAVYGGELDVQTPVGPDDSPCPIRVLWYEGDYRERVPRLSPREEDPDKKVRATCVNRKQLAIMREEEGLRIRQYAREGKSICILAPFNGQISLIQTFVRGLLADIVAQDDIRLESGDEGEGAPRSFEGVYALTIHKSQGQEFDVVYLLPVEDGNWEWPWSQGRRLVNVAASRAKSELRVILSTKLMNPRTQEWLAGRQAYVRKPAKPEDDPGDQQMFVRKMVDYARRRIEALGDGSADLPSFGEFGFHRSVIRSMFDEIPFLQNPRKKSSDFAPEQCMECALKKMVLPGFAWAKHVPFNRLALKGVSRASVGVARLSELVDDWYKVPDEAHFDFVIFDEVTRRVLVAIEVDGAWHRFKKGKQGFDFSQIASDDRKDCVMRDVCGATLAWLGLIRDGSLYRGSGGFERRAAEVQRARRALAFASGASAKAVERGGDSNHEDEEPLRLQTGWDDWARFPREVGADSSFVLLRIPSDGSTFWETDVLRAEARSTGADASLASGYAPPTIEDYVRAQAKANALGGNAAAFVEEGVEAHAFGAASHKVSGSAARDANATRACVAGGVRAQRTGAAAGGAVPGVARAGQSSGRHDGGAVTVSCCLDEWRRDPRLAGMLAGITPKRMNECLVAAGFQEFEHGDSRLRIPTEKGRSIGMSSRNGQDDAGRTYAVPVYSEQARSYLAERMGEILGFDA